MVLLIVSLIVSACLTVYAGKSFYETWKPSSMVHGFLARIADDTDQALIIVAMGLAIIALPALYMVIYKCLECFCRMAVKVVKGCSMKSITCDRKTTIRSIAMIACNLVIAIVLGTVLLVCAFKLPVDNIDRNVRDSASTFEAEGSYPTIFSWCTSKLDNFTDAIMLSEAANDMRQTAVEKAMLAYRGGIKGQDPCESLVSHYQYGREYNKNYSYARYWHGYQIILKSLLEVMDYGSIRLLNLIMQVMIAAIIAVLMIKRKLKHFVPAYLLGYLMLMPLALGSSLQFSSCYYVLSLGTVAILILPENIRRKYAYLVFLNIGIFTAYFDLLTYPIATFGIPAVMYVAIQQSHSLETKLGDMVKNGIAWCVGFGCMWASKWLVTYILTGYNAVGEALSAFSFRVSNVSADGAEISKAVCEISNYRTFIFTPITIICILLVAYMLVKINKTTGNNVAENMLTHMIPYTVLAFAPAVWFAFATNHSMIHCWFTNKACVVTFVALMFGVADLYNRYVKAGSENLLRGEADG